MRKIHFALIGAASIALAACGGREEDTLTEDSGDVLQADELNALANDAAMDAQQEMGPEVQPVQVEPAPAVEETSDEPAEQVVTEHSEVDDEPLGL